MRRVKKQVGVLVLCGLALTAVLLAAVLSFEVWHDQKVKILCRSHLRIIAHDIGHVLDDDRILPAADNLVLAFSQMADTMTDSEKEKTRTLNLVAGGSALYCPSSFNRDGSVGYVYLGDGLRLGDVKEKNILILFCSAESHGGWSPIWRAYDLSDQVYTCSEMVNILRDAIRRGEEGDVPYSERAMAVLRDELSKRDRN